MTPRIKILANYLPQFHRIPENDLFWGEGFTDWEAVKKASPVYEGQVQPRVPLGELYYDLAEPDVIANQAKLAREYGIWGFGIYHYWFNSSQCLLTKPAENLLMQPEIDINYMFIWDNASWVRTWSSVNGNAWSPQFDGRQIEEVTHYTKEEQARFQAEEEGLLVKFDLGGPDDWEKHFRFLLPYFKDPRYIRIEGKPVFAIWGTRGQFEAYKDMFSYWNELAKDEGIPGVVPLCKAIWKRRYFQYEFEYPFPIRVDSFFDWLREKPGLERWKRHRFLRIRDYDDMWKGIIRFAKYGRRMFAYSGFAHYDDTPRRGMEANIYKGGSPEKFERYLRELIDISLKRGNEYLFLVAWNEWGEGAYLEPDEQYGYAYLEAVRKAVMA